MRVALVGNRGGSQVGSSLDRAMRAMGHDVLFVDAAEAFSKNRIRRAIDWHAGRRPSHLRKFAWQLVQSLGAFHPDVLLTTGFAPVRAPTLRIIRGTGATCINFLTDDPWNPGFSARWIMESIAAYDVVFSPRQANIDELLRLGIPKVEYLPFGYDPEIFSPAPPEELKYDIIFAGGADRDRAPLMTKLVQAGFRLALYGHDWERFKELRPVTQGLIPPPELKYAIAETAVALCIVRRANRDGHVMRTYELPAMRACILAEDTPEHRAILGDTVRYFSTDSEMIARLRELLADPAERERLAGAAHSRITGSSNTYADRAAVMLAEAQPGR